MTKANIEKKLAIQKASPQKKLVGAVTYGICSVTILISLIDYNPDSYHSSPNIDNSPLLGQFGIYIARNVLSILGLSAWVLPWVLGSFSYMSFKGITPKEKLLKGLSFLVSILCISILANIRDTQGIKSNNGSLFNSNLY